MKDFIKKYWKIGLLIIIIFALAVWWLVGVVIALIREVQDYGLIETILNLFYLFILLYALYGFVKICLLKEENKGKDYRIAKLEQRIEYLEEQLRKGADNNGN